jgi:multiple sugar transport system substrate-binding protein
MSRATNHVLIWKRLLEEAGFTLGDIPKEWDGFWSFWCEQVQPAVRRATGRDDIWGIGLNMSDKATEPTFQFFQFLAAYDADYVTWDGRLIIDDPKVRRANSNQLSRRACSFADSAATRLRFATVTTTLYTFA